MSKRQHDKSFLRSVRLHSELEGRIDALLKARGENFNEMVNRLIRKEAVPDRCPTCGQAIPKKKGGR